MMKQQIATAVNSMSDAILNQPQITRQRHVSFAITLLERMPDTDLKECFPSNPISEVRAYLKELRDAGLSFLPCRCEDPSAGRFLQRLGKMSQRQALGLDSKRRRASAREHIVGALPRIGNGHTEIYRARANATEPLCKARGPGMCICKFATLHETVISGFITRDEVAIEPQTYHECACGKTWPVKEAA